MTSQEKAPPLKGQNARGHIDIHIDSLLSVGFGRKNVINRSAESKRSNNMLAFFFSSVGNKNISFYGLKDHVVYILD